MIESKDITVIVQGQVKAKITHKCLKSIRKYLPDSEIILSTWEGTDTNGLDFDKLVLSKDPGAKKHDFIHNSYNNVNRQLVSTQAGLNVAKRQYCLKLRTDALLKNDHFINYWDKFKKRNSDYSLFQNRIMISSSYTREASNETGYPLPFHPSDFWWFGLTKDIDSFFIDTPLLAQDAMNNCKFKYPNRLPYRIPIWRYPPEQYYMVSFLERCNKFEFTFDDWSDWNEDVINLSQNIMYNNFIILETHQSGIYNQKHNWIDKYDNEITGLVTYELFQHRYKEFCDPQYEMNKIEYARLKLIRRNRQIRNNYNILKQPVKRTFKWLILLIKTFFYTLRSIILHLYYTYIK